MSVRAMRWCQPCKSYHVDPKSKGEWKVLRCFRPWATWQRIVKRESKAKCR